MQRERPASCVEVRDQQAPAGPVTRYISRNAAARCRAGTWCIASVQVTALNDASGTGRPRVMPTVNVMAPSRGAAR